MSQDKRWNRLYKRGDEWMTIGLMILRCGTFLIMLLVITYPGQPSIGKALFGALAVVLFYVVITRTSILLWERGYDELMIKRKVPEEKVEQQNSKIQLKDQQQTSCVSFVPTSNRDMPEI